MMSRVSNSLDPDQARHNVGPDLGPNCLQWLKADDTRVQRVNIYIPNVFIKTLHIKPFECKVVTTQ